MSNEEAINILYSIRAYYASLTVGYPPHDCYGLGDMKCSDICNALLKGIKLLKQEPCEDAISRQTLIERINNAEENFKSGNMESIASDDGDPFVDDVLSVVFNIQQMVMQAPPVTPQQKTGHWIAEINDYGEVMGWHCDKCYENSGFTTTCKWDFCLNCGARMEKE